MNHHHTPPRSARVRRAGSVGLILAVIISLLPTAAPQRAGAQEGNSQIRYPISDTKMGLWFEGVPEADPDNLRFNEIDDPAPNNDGDATYIVTTAIKSYQAGIAAPDVPADATNISVSVIWAVRYEESDSFHVSWSRLGVNGKAFFGPTHNPGTIYTTYTDTWTNNPDTGLEWTPETANTVDGLGFDSNVKTAVHVTQGYIQISYEMGPPAPLDVEKYVWDGTDWVDADVITGPYLLPGTDPQFKFVVTNNSDEDLSNVDLTDDVYGDISLDGTLAAGDSAEYFYTGTWAQGQHTNTATVTGDYDGGTYSDDDDANYFGSLPAPAIDVEKYVWDGAAWMDADVITGPYLLPGTDPQFKFVVTNTGNEDLSNVDLTDNVYGDISLDGTLDVGDSEAYFVTGTWTEGQHTNTATVTGVHDDDTYSDSDDANYFGAAPAIDVEKYVWDGTAWVDADVITGPYLLPGTDPQFKFVVDNTGNVDLSNVDLTDNVYGDVSLDGTLAAGASAEYFITGTWAQGQHTNTATVTGDHGDNTYSDSDDANYFGAAPAIDVEKYVWDGTDWVDADEITGPYLLPGTDPQFKFVVDNTGNVDLSNVDLTDNVYGDISLDGTLAAGNSEEYFVTGNWAEGQHTNTVTVTGDYDGNTYTDSDDANYFGGAPAIDVEKHVWDGTAWVDADEITGPYLLPGTDPQFKFVVANIGKVDLSNVDLTDNVYGDISLDGTLDAGTSADYFVTGTWAQGQHTNTATATGDYDGNTYTDSDDANYFGAAPAIDVEKYIWDGTAWVDADEITGPYLLPGTDPQFKFVVANTGNVDLSNVDLTDNVYGDISLDGTLAAGASADYFITGTWAEGQHTNTVTVTGDYDGNTYTDSDDANYFGGAPALTLVKTASPTTYSSVGDVIVYSYQLTNGRDLPLDAPFTVTDDKVSVTCPETPVSLAPGESIVCTANYNITLSDLDAGSVTNTAQGHGYYDGTPVGSNYDYETVTAIFRVYLPVVLGGHPPLTTYADQASD